MMMTFRITQLTDVIGEESPEKTGPLGEVLFHEIKGCFFGVLPPFEVLNFDLRRGEIVDSGNRLFRWKPFALTALEYEQLKREVLAHPEWQVEIDDTYDGPVNEWGHWALVRAIGK